MRQRLASELGGARGSIEAALPIAVFTVVYLTTDDVPTAAIVAVGVAAAAFALRWWQGSPTRFVGNGLLGIVIAAVVATATGQAEAAFLPGILTSAAYAVVLGGSVVVRRPIAGLVIGAVLGDMTAWRRSRPVRRLADRLTLVLAAPMALRVAVQLPLYVAGEVGWLGVSRIALGWPLHALTLTVAGMLLLRGRTPLDAASEP